MSAAHISVKDALYEAPGPKARRTTAVVTIASLLLFAVMMCFVVRQFIVTGQLSARYWSFFSRHTTWIFLGKGLLGTFEATASAGVLAFMAGFLMMMGRISRYKAVQAVSAALVEITRGIPTLLFIYFFFLVIPQLGVKLPSLLRISMPVAISASGIVAESLRSGVNAVSKGQREAALSLGMIDSHVFFKIIFPQALRYILPSLVAELVIVLKDTTFAYIVNFPDLMQNAKVLISNYDAMLSVYLIAAIIYIAVNYLLNRVAVMIASRRNKIFNKIFMGTK